jgi:Zn-dependent protease
MTNFRVFGFPVQIQLFFWIVGAVLSLLWAGNDVAAAVLIFGVFFISILGHELGHALAVRKFGSRPSIILHGFGGLTMYAGGMFSRNQSIIISLSGPAVSLALAAAFFLLLNVLGMIRGSNLNPGDPMIMAVYAGMILNFIWTVLNLMPVMPLDGGQVLREILGPGKARTTAIVGAVTGGILAVYFLIIMQPFIAILFGVLAWQNYTRTTPAGGVVRG